MQISVLEAAGKLAELLQRAEAGEDVVVTRSGHVAVRLVPVTRQGEGVQSREAVLDQLRHAAAKKATPGPSAARSQDFLYGGDGLPD